VSVTMVDSEREAVDRFGRWLTDEVVNDATGRGVDVIDVNPEGRFWLGTLISEELQLRLDRGERGERLDPAMVGLRFQPTGPGPWRLQIELSFCLWHEPDETGWHKSERVQVDGLIEVGTSATGLLRKEIADEITKVTGHHELGAQVEIDTVPGLDRDALEVSLLNTSPESVKGLSTHFYEVVIRIKADGVEPFLVASLPDSFRYDRRVWAYGVNTGVQRDEDGWLTTVDALEAEQHRPSYWNASVPAPDITFAGLAKDPLPALSSLVDIHRKWGEDHWSDEALQMSARQQDWTDEMWEAARVGREEFLAESERLTQGLAALESDEVLLRSFQLMNQAMVHSSRGKYPGWRPFQIGFVLATCPAVADPTGHSDHADIVWFATGGGKTETYLGLVVMAALHDRLTGKVCGVTAWSRFPLRLLSLQQTQRFADAMAGAELVRTAESIGGDPFSLGFLIGDSSTPNRIDPDPDEDWKPNPEDPEMPAKYRVLLECPFCFQDGIEMHFDHALWILDHRCTNTACPWGDKPLPFRIVDDEIYRFLPTVIVGTLDKIASISIQASMAGLFGPPRAVCSAPNHGHTYAERSKKPKGCLVPGCDRKIEPLPQPKDRYAPTFRLQDELHLLRDALGAVNAHYESLIDYLQFETTGTKAKILGSSATLSGYEHQVDVLYRRTGRVFPAQGPSASSGFWTAESEEIARRHLALAPRGATIEFANDRIITVLQSRVRELVSSPEKVCSRAGVDAPYAPLLIDLFATNVVYGNTIRDLDAAARSLETQIPVEGQLNTATLTGQTPFEEVRETLQRLQDHELAFEDQVHVITASSMMSHGVDIDRLNSMIILGLPLTTAEYIQTTARVGRSWPGFVFVLHKMARERDASTIRSWRQFVRQGDRFVEPVPVTRRSVRVLDRTAPGLFLGRLLHIHERKAGEPLTTVRNLNRYDGLDEATEARELKQLLRLDNELDVPIRKAIDEWMERYFDNLRDPGDARFPSELCPGGNGAMLSLRDVEEMAPVAQHFEGTNQ